MTAITSRPVATSLLILCACTLAAGLISWVSPTTLSRLLGENGPIEYLSVLVWLGCAVLVSRHRLPWARQLAHVGFFVALAIREAGLPAWLIPSGKALMSPGHYLGAGSVSGVRASIEGLLVLFFLYAIGRTLFHFADFFRARHRWAQPDAQWALMALLALMLAQLSDRGLAWSWLALLEEVFEATAAGFMVCAINGSRRMAEAPQPGVGRLLFPHRPS